MQQRIRCDRERNRQGMALYIRVADAHIPDTCCQSGRRQHSELAAADEGDTLRRRLPEVDIGAINEIGACDQDDDRLPQSLPVRRNATDDWAWRG